MKATGSKPAAPTTIINLTSAADIYIPEGMSSYSLSTLTVIHFTAFLKAESPDITSVSINPGVVSTDMEELEAWKEELIQSNLLTICLRGRFGE